MYTKGEWEAKISKANRYWKAEVRTPDIMDDEGKHALEFGQLIAVCYGKNTIANAHLIAAAPELYEACRSMLPLITTEWNGPIQEMAKQAIAKAEVK